MEAVFRIRTRLCAKLFSYRPSGIGLPGTEDRCWFYNPTPHGGPVFPGSSLPRDQWCWHLEMANRILTHGPFDLTDFFSSEARRFYGSHPNLFCECQGLRNSRQILQAFGDRLSMAALLTEGSHLFGTISATGSGQTTPTWHKLTICSVSWCSHHTCTARYRDCSAFE